MPIMDRRWGLDHHAGYGVSLANESFTGPGAEAHYPPDLGLLPEHLRIHVGVTPAEAHLCGSVTTTVRAQRAGCRTLQLNAVDFSSVDVQPADGQELEWSYDGKQIEICWAKPVGSGEERQFTVTYEVKDPTAGLYFMHPDETYPDKAVYAATDHETEKARHWLPCIDLPNVRTTLEVVLDAPAELTALANGYFVGEEDLDKGRKRTTWKLDQKCPSYLVCFAIGDFSRCDDGEFEGIPLAYFASKHFSAEDLKRSFGRTGDMLAWMTKRLGVKFPYPKYFQFALPGYGGAMENISLVSWNDEFVLDEELAPEWTWLTDQINVHEMAHSYFGDLVVCRDYAHAWLKESWATYIESCWLEDSKGQDEQRYDFWRNAQAYFSEADGEYMRPLVTRTFNSSWQMYDRHLYPGGACRMHTLRSELGDDVFWAAVNDYLETYSEKTVETDDYRQIMEKHSGRSLVRFFEQWVYSPGYPNLKIEFEYDKEAGVGTFNIEQTQAGKKVEGTDMVQPTFEFQSHLAWNVKGKEEKFAIKMDRAKQSFTFKMKSEPDMVRFDPDCVVLHKLDFNPGDDKLLKQLTDAPDVIGRVEAALTLGKSGKAKNLDAIFKAYKKEKFWGVRQQMVAALQKAGTAAAVRHLADLIAWEKDPMVMEMLFWRGGQFRDEAVKQALLARLEAGDLPVLATCSIYQALGMQRDDDVLKILMDAAEKQDEHYGFKRRSALKGLAFSRDSDAAKFLTSKAKYGKLPFRGRHELGRAMGAISEHVSKKYQGKIEDRLVDLLRDPDPEVQMWAAWGLARGRFEKSAGKVSAYAATIAHQDAVSVREWMREMGGADEAKATKLQKKLEDLEEKYRKLEDRFMTFEAKANKK